MSRWTNGNGYGGRRLNLKIVLQMTDPITARPSDESPCDPLPLERLGTPAGETSTTRKGSPFAEESAEPLAQNTLTAEAAKAATAMLVVFGVTAAYWFPEGVPAISLLGCAVAILAIGVPGQRIALVCLAIHASLTAWVLTQRL